MLEWYWGFFIAGLALAIMTILFGEVLDGLLEGALEFLNIGDSGVAHPVSLVGGMTAFGGIGILLTRHTSFGTGAVLAGSLGASVFLIILLHFVYVKPMRKAENSTSYSLRDLVGRFGEVTVGIPADGFGEVLVKAGAGRVNQIASSFDGKEIPNGSRVIIVDVADGVLQVSLYENFD